MKETKIKPRYRFPLIKRIKNFYSLKDTIKIIKESHRLGGKFANTFVKGLEHAQLNKKKTDDSIFFNE